MLTLYKPISYQKSTAEERQDICNGCGSAKAKFDFVPDTIYGLRITAACYVHDWMYHKGKTIEDKKEADFYVLIICSDCWVRNQR